MPNHNINRMAGMSGAAVAGHAITDLATSGTGQKVIAKVGDSYGVIMTMAFIPVVFALLCYGLVEGSDYVGPFETLFNLLGAMCGIMAVLTEIALAPFQVLAAWKTLVLLVKFAFKLLVWVLLIPKRAIEAKQRRELIRLCDEGRELIAEVRNRKKQV